MLILDSGCRARWQGGKVATYDVCESTGILVYIIL